MLPKLKLSNALCNRLLSLTETCYGGLYGVMHNRSILLLSFSLNVDGTKQTDPFMEMQLRLPTGIDFCGLLIIDEIMDAGSISEAVIKSLKEVIVTDNPVVLTKDVNTDQISCKIFSNGKLIPADYEMFTMSDFNDSFLTIRLRTSLYLSGHTNKKKVLKSVDRLYNLVSSGSVVFHFQSTDIFLSGGDYDNSPDSSPGLGTLYNQVPLLHDPRIKEGVMELTMLIQSSGANFDERTHIAPFLSSDNDVSKQFIMMFPVDVLCLAEKSRIARESYGLFVDAVCRSIQHFRMKILLTSDEPCLLNRLKHYHFAPDKFGHLLSTIYPVGLDDNDLYLIRRKLHKELCIPMDTPVFRISNSLSFVGTKSLGPLINVHVGLKPSGVKDGKISLVKGYYEYYHYMQQNFDDNGWGCAYRSFQTIFSWFRLQGYTSLTVPTHLEVQQCLFKLNDKPNSFVGSKQWIGSTEVVFCLDSMIGVTSRILSVSNNLEFDSVADELQCHFELHGSPVMIGGGVLAHTILGIDFNNSSGEVKFLVLDPHYTGDDSLKNIQSKGWVSWKTKTFWSKKTFYNMCLPQRPKCI